MNLWTHWPCSPRGASRGGLLHLENTESGDPRPFVMMRTGPHPRHRILDCTGSPFASMRYADLPVKKNGVRRRMWRGPGLGRNERRPR